MASASPNHRAATRAAAIRPARPDDLPTIIEIYNSSVPGRQATADLDPVSPEDRVTWFDKHDQHRPLFVAERATTVLGWLSFEDFYGRPAYRRTAEVSIYVASASQRRGVGQALLAHGLRHAQSHDLRVLVAFVFGHNTPSLRLFERHGFVRSGHLAEVAELDGVLRDLVVLTNRLRGC